MGKNYFIDMKRNTLLALILVVAILFVVIIFLPFKSSPDQPEEKGFSLAVVVPGVAAGSPLYENLVSGAEKAVAENPGATLKIHELGYNQAEWQEKLTAIVATGLYDLVVTSNPAMPFIILEAVKDFPDQKFLVVDAVYPDHPRMATVLDNQVEQSYLRGHMAGLLSSSDLAGDPANRVGFLVAQEYPALNQMIEPGFLAGARAVDPSITLDRRVLGNWYDANKASDLAKSMIESGVKVIGTICGGANQGVLDAAKEAGVYVVMWDSNEYARVPGTVAGSGALAQERLVYEEVSRAVAGELEFGTARVVSLAEGYVEFITDDPHYRDTVPQALRDRQDQVIASIKEGSLKLDVPEF